MLVLGLLLGCGPAAVAEAPVGPPPGTSSTTGPAETAAANEPVCPAETQWEGDQCVQIRPAETTKTAPPEPDPEASATADPGGSLKFELQNGALKLPGPVLFETGKDTIRKESDSVLGVVKAYLIAKPEITLLRIEGHTDNMGSAALNQALSEKRALSCARWLVAHGVDCKRLIPVGFGDAKPIADNKTAEGRALNRRMSFVNASLKGRAIGGMPVDGGGKASGDPCAKTP